MNSFALSFTSGVVWSLALIVTAIPWLIALDPRGPSVQMLERAQAVGQYPTRSAVYSDPRLRVALAIPPDDARRAIESATPRPVTPIYTELSEILQIELHRALVRQVPREPAQQSPFWRSRRAACEPAPSVDHTKRHSMYE